MQLRGGRMIVDQVAEFLEESGRSKAAKELREEFSVATGALRAICTTNDSGPWIAVYRTAGGGYEGLQAIASAALLMLEPE
jgi:hypothetical protein